MLSEVEEWYVNSVLMQHFLLKLTDSYSYWYCTYTTAKQKYTLHMTAQSFDWVSGREDKKAK